VGGYATIVVGTDGSETSYLAVERDVLAVHTT
jgi:hypothetical protein